MTQRDIFRTVSSATKGVLDMIATDLETASSTILFSPESPDGDQSKFSIHGGVARAIHRFQGYHLPVRSEWFDGQSPKPVINKGEFDYYALAIEPKVDDPNPHYLLVHYLKLREWVLEFEAPLGRDWQDSRTWMANVHVFSDGVGYFKWGDEPTSSADASDDPYWNSCINVSSQTKISLCHLLVSNLLASVRVIPAFPGVDD